MYAVVIEYKPKTENCSYIVMNDELDAIVSRPKMCANLHELAIDCMKLKLKPYNFSLNRSGEIVQDSGAFTRLTPFSGIVLGEFVTKTGRKQGYKLLLTTGEICNKRIEDIVKRDKALGEDVPFLQNAIIRLNVVSCYSNHSFKQTVIGTETKKSVEDIKVTKAVQPINNVEEVKEPEKAEPEKEAEVYTKQQKREIKACKDAGIKSDFIENPELSHTQMRVLWVSKSKGAYSEYFNNPQMSVDVMKFYAEKLDNKKIVEECQPILEHPEYDLPKVKLLYDCIMRGLDINEFANEPVSVIETKQLEAEAEQWGYKLPIGDSDKVKKYLSESKRLEKNYELEQLKKQSIEDVQADLDAYMARHGASNNIDAVKKAKEDYVQAHPEAKGKLVAVAITGNGQYDIQPVPETKETKKMLKAIKKFREENPDASKAGLLSIQARLKKNKKDDSTKTVYEVSVVDNSVGNQDMVYSELV